MKPYRIALCFSGQPRTWEFAVKSIKHFFSRQDHPETFVPIKYDIFIHTWDTNSYRPNTATQEFTHEQVTPDLKQKLIEAYNPVDVCVDKWDGFLERTNSTRNFDGMFYSFMKSVHMKRKHELANDFEYDLVIKLRLDTIYNPHTNFIPHVMSPLMMYTCTPIAKFPFEFHYNNFDDVFFYGDSKTMDLASNIYYIHHQKAAPIDMTGIGNVAPEFFYGPGTMIYRNLIDMSIHPTCFYSFPWYVVRKNVAESGLDPIYDWEQVMKMCMDWYR